MQKTVLNEIHKQLGARMVPFAGFEMPVEYSGITHEHMAVREAAGLFDVSHMGEFLVAGPHAFDFVQFVTSNNVADLPVGKAQYSCMPNNDGGIVDDLIVYHLEEDKYMLVVNAANMDKDWDWCMKNNHVGAELENRSHQISLLAVQGPKALEIMQPLTSVDLSRIAFYSFTTGDFAGVDNVIISNTGYTGSGGFELYISNDAAVKVWEILMKEGGDKGLVPAGLGARDTLRLEAGFALYGNDLNDRTTPIEAGLSWITKLVEGNDFISRPILEKQKNEGVEKRLKGFVLEDRGIPRKGYEIVDASGNLIGEVTSGTMSPILKKGIGMGYLNKGFWAIDTEIFIRIRNRDLKARVVKPPFVKLK
ncbi:glycine cleavage system aminomethyltransferase GcvT [Thermophagus sp. OGC60D27]|uniref:glycine cleavage system aminomethyltransferase GcvT n=1 Tax=Thermophagus sp. OGC60D27 TaxID=3458415 RepID=UPI004037EFFB